MTTNNETKKQPVKQFRIGAISATILLSGTYAEPVERLFPVTTLSNCLGMSWRDNGHRRFPEPPAMIST